jgi:hypothetical protein
MSGIANIFSTIDSIKRVLADYVSSPVESMKRAGASAKESPLTVDQAMNFMPGAIGKILFHGGPQAVTKINPDLGQNLAKGPGFYLSNILNTPLNFATKGGKQAGVISAFDIPDADYAKMLRINEKPLSTQTVIEDLIKQLFKDVPELQRRADVNVKYNGRPVHGDWLNQQMEALYGVRGAAEELTKLGIPGKTWQYSHDRPAEMASVVFPDYSNLLEPIAQLSVEPGIAGARAANMAMKAILGITK